MCLRRNHAPLPDKLLQPLFLFAVFAPSTKQMFPFAVLIHYLYPDVPAPALQLIRTKTRFGINLPATRRVHSVFLFPLIIPVTIMTGNSMTLQAATRTMFLQTPHL